METSYLVIGMNGRKNVRKLFEGKYAKENAKDWAFKLRSFGFLVETKTFGGKSLDFQDSISVCNQANERLSE